MTAANRSALLTKLHKVLRKHYEPAIAPTGRTVLEHLLYACCLENSRHADVDDVFARLTEAYFDWNEVRVTTVTELAEVMASLIDPVDSAKRLKTTLQSVFETHYAFDIDALRKQNLGKSIKDMERYKGISPFILAYVTQNALGGHAIPVNSGLMEVFTLLGLTSDDEAEEGKTPGLERAIPKNKGPEFASLVHQFGVDFRINPSSAKIRSILLEVMPEGLEQGIKRSSKKEVAAGEPMPAAARKAEPQTDKAAAVPKAAAKSLADKRAAVSSAQPAAVPSQESPPGDTSTGKGGKAPAKSGGGKSEPKTPVKKGEHPGPDSPSAESPAKESAKGKPTLPAAKPKAKAATSPPLTIRTKPPQAEDAKPSSTKRLTTKSESAHSNAVDQPESAHSEVSAETGLKDGPNLAPPEAAKAAKSKATPAKPTSGSSTPAAPRMTTEAVPEAAAESTKLAPPGPAASGSNTSTPAKTTPAKDDRAKSATGPTAAKKSAEAKGTGSKAVNKPQEDAPAVAERPTDVEPTSSPAAKNREGGAGPRREEPAPREKTEARSATSDQPPQAKKTPRKTTDALPPVNADSTGADGPESEPAAETSTSESKRLSRKKPR